MFYQLDHSRVPFRELVHGGSISWLILGLPVMLVRKLFRIRSLVPAAIPDSLEPFLADRSAIPDEVQTKMEPLEAQLRDFGFIDPVYHWIVDPFTSMKIAVATYRHRSGTSLGQTRFTRLDTRKPPLESLRTLFLTAYTDGTSYASSTDPGRSWGSLGCRGQRIPGASVGELWRLHGRQVSLDSLNRTIETAYTRAESRAILERVEATEREYLVRRGILVPRTDAQQQTAEAVMATPGDETDREFAAVYSEMDRLANRKASATTGLLVLVITVVVFLVLGRGGRPWKPLVLLSVVLLVHELGHLAAMRLFHYRNLPMFFIPLFGAAVTGQNYNVPGWKKAVVSLMGPLPGVALGAVLAVVGATSQSPAVVQAAYLFLAINAFNLLPIMPLDGGRVMHAVLFSRHPMFDVAFRAIAAAVLMLSFLAGMEGLAVVGVVMLLGLRMHYRVAKVVHRLRGQGLDATSPDAQTIPVETARRIHDELRAALPTQLPAKASAQWTLQAFELLNARPPGLLASLGLIGVHAAGFCVAVVVVFALMVAHHDARRHPQPPAAQPPRQLAAELAPPPARCPIFVPAVAIRGGAVTPFDTRARLM